MILAVGYCFPAPLLCQNYVADVSVYHREYVPQVS